MEYRADLILYVGKVAADALSFIIKSFMVTVCFLTVVNVFRKNNS